MRPRWRQEDGDGFTALMWAARFGHPQAEVSVKKCVFEGFRIYTGKGVEGLGLSSCTGCSLGFIGFGV